jgi:hypothetical protein
VTVLDVAVPFPTEERVYRVTLSADEYGRLQRIRDIVGTGPEFQEALDFLNVGKVPLPPVTLDTLLDFPFGRRPFPTGRFSDGSHPVLYTAVEPETAGSEYSHWAPSAFFADGGRPYQIRVHLFSCHFAGTVKDLRPFHVTFPGLTDPHDHRECQAIGSAALAEGLAGLISVSARRLTGTTLPIFSRGAASRPNWEGEVHVIIDQNAPGGATATFTLP